MKYHKTFFILVFVFIFFYRPAFSQNTITTSGGTAANKHGALSFTLGQVFMENEKTEDIIISEGVQQPFEIFVSSLPGQQIDQPIQVSVYPIPAQNYVTVDIALSPDIIASGIYFLLFDLNGQLIHQGKINTEKYNLHLNSYSKGTYFLNIWSQTTGEISIHKIIKR